MIYRNLGNTGLKVSVLSFGNWVTGHDEKAEENQIQIIKKAYESGINFFDTAEAYGFGVGEKLLGKAIKSLDAKRSDLVISTKLFLSVKPNSNPINQNGLSRKHIMEGMNQSLKNLDLEYVDIVFCHRPDYETPLEEVCRGMSDLIKQGKAFYWSTSEWPASLIAAALEICKYQHLHLPIADQCEYNLLVREKMEKEYAPVFQRYSYGTTIWSPLASGFLSGKYNDGVQPDDSRLKDPQYERIWNKYINMKDIFKKLKAFNELAKELGVSQAQLAIAWIIANEDVSTCILGASKMSQLEDNLKALDLLAKWNKDIDERINKIFDNEPEPILNFRTWTPYPNRRLKNKQ